MTADIMTIQSNKRDWTTEELDTRFRNKKTLICPICTTTKFQVGPEGGNSQNCRCANGHEWNVHTFGMDWLGELSHDR